jgi:peptidyl-prolyl cis-trans isomerase A (cyclophilin A)
MDSQMRNRIFTAAAAALLAAGCSSKTEPEKSMSAPSSKVETAPEKFSVNFDTSKGAFTVEVTKALSPFGADRFYNLVKSGYFDGARFFRMLPGFIVQFGIAGDPSISSLFRHSTIPDDPVKTPNREGTITFATAGPGTRTTQIFINLGDNERLDGQGFSPFGKVTSGMDVVKSFYAGYGEGQPRGNGPDQSRIENEGNAYLEKDFPRLDYIKKAAIAP